VSTVIRRPAAPNPTARPPEAQPLTYDQQRVRRDGELDLEFVGALLASSRYSSDGDRFTEVDLFITMSGRFVSCVRFGSSTRATMRHDAQVCDSPETVIAWMRGSSGRIGTASKDVLERAFRLYPDLFPMRPVEVIT
jgi:hypothetical protein